MSQESRLILEFKTFKTQQKFKVLHRVHQEPLPHRHQQTNKIKNPPKKSLIERVKFFLGIGSSKGKGKGKGKRSKIDKSQISVPSNFQHVTSMIQSPFTASGRVPPLRKAASTGDMLNDLQFQLTSAAIAGSDYVQDGTLGSSQGKTGQSGSLKPSGLPPPLPKGSPPKRNGKGKRWRSNPDLLDSTTEQQQTSSSNNPSTSDMKATSKPDPTKIRSNTPPPKPPRLYLSFIGSPSGASQAQAASATTTTTSLTSTSISSASSQGNPQPSTSSSSNQPGTSKQKRKPQQSPPQSGMDPQLKKLLERQRKKTQN